MLLQCVGTIATTEIVTVIDVVMFSETTFNFDATLI